MAGHFRPLAFFGRNENARHLETVTRVPDIEDVELLLPARPLVQAAREVSTPEIVERLVWRQRRTGLCGQQLSVSGPFAANDVRRRGGVAEGDDQQDSAHRSTPIAALRARRCARRAQP